MKTNFVELIETQTKVNEVVNQRLELNGLEKPKPIGYLVAMHVELFEFINAIGIWKWWKHSHKKDKEKILDELADIMAFFLSLVEKDYTSQSTMDEIFDEAEEQMKDYDTVKLIQSISAAIQYGETDLDYVVLMGLAIEIARREVEATWEEIKNAYLKKSAENIARQLGGY